MDRTIRPAMRKKSQRKEHIKYRIGDGEKGYTISVDILIERFSSSNEAKNYTKYYYSFNTCMLRFLLNEIKGIQELGEGQFSLLKSRFDERYNTHGSD